MPLERNPGVPSVYEELERRLRPLIGPLVRIDIVRAPSLPPGLRRTDLTWRT